MNASPTRLEVSKSGAQLYAVMPSADQVAVIDLASRAVAANIPVGSRPSAIALNAAGTRAYVANLWSGDVSIVDTSSRTVISTFPTGSGPSAVAVSGDGASVFVSNQFSNSVTVHSASGQSKGTISGFVFPNGVAITPDGARLFVTNGNAGTVSIVNLAQLAIASTLPTGALPTAVAVSADGRRAYVTNQNSFSLSVIDAASGALITNIGKVGVYPVGVAVKPFTPANSGPVCTYSVSSSSASFPAGGATSSIQVSVSAGCPWSASSNADWVRITAGASGNGSGAVSFAVDGNAGIAGRSAVLTIAGQQVSIAQGGVSCSFSLSSTGASLPSAGGSGAVTVVSLPGCSWNAVSSAAWLSAGSNSGVGLTTLTFAAAANSDSASRTATLTIGGQQFTVTQAGREFSPIRINCGGPAFTDSQGRWWAADEQRNRSTTTAPISGTDVPLLYQTESWGDDLSYRFDVPNGSYAVTLRFAEIYLSQAGQRVFHVYINGVQVAASVDIVAAAGKNSARDLTFTANVSGGQLVIRLEGATGTPKLSGIEIR